MDHSISSCLRAASLPTRLYKFQTLFARPHSRISQFLELYLTGLFSGRILTDTDLKIMLRLRLVPGSHHFSASKRQHDNHQHARLFSGLVDEGQHRWREAGLAREHLLTLESSGKSLTSLSLSFIICKYIQWFLSLIKV